MSIPLAHPGVGPSYLAAGEDRTAMQWNADWQNFDALVRENLPAVHRFAIRLTGDLDSAEELVQDVMLRATRSWQTYRGEAQFRTWLFRVAVNAFRDGKRKRPGPEGFLDGVAEGLADTARAGPVARAEQDERGQLVAKAVSSLPPRQREVLVLHTYEQLGTAEVAKVLGISEVNVRAQLSYARTRLKELLAAYRV